MLVYNIICVHAYIYVDSRYASISRITVVCSIIAISILLCLCVMCPFIIQIILIITHV